MTAHPRSLDGRLPPTPTKYKWWRFIEHRLPFMVIYLMVATLVVVVLAPYVVKTVPSGQIGLLWKRFRGGTQLEPRLLKAEGLRIILPWDELFLYDLRLQTSTDTYNAITKDGIHLIASINIRFRLKHDSIPQLHQAIGPNYLDLMVRPEIGSRMREVIAEYTAEEVYSTKRQEIQNKIRRHSEVMMGEKMIQRTAEESEYGESYQTRLDATISLYDTLVLGMQLPPAVVGAINRKIEQYYLAEEYTFRVARERKESERKKIEAEGISEFQRIVSQGISDSYLRWRGIEATLQLALSTNAKIVIIGSGRDGMPIILGNVDAPPAPPAPQAGGTQPTEDRTMPKERTTATSPTMPLEKTPASNLATPFEGTEPAGSETPAEKTPAAVPPGRQSAATPEEPRFLFPRSLSDIKSILSRMVRPTEPKTEALSKQPSERPAPVQPR